MNFNLHFQTLLTVSGALMETIPRAVHSIEPYHVGLLDSLIISELGSSLPQGAQEAQRSQNRKTGYLCKMSVPMGGFHSLFWLWQATIPNFFLAQLHLITNMYHRNGQHIRTTKGDIVASSNFLWNTKPPFMFTPVFT